MSYLVHSNVLNSEMRVLDSFSKTAAVPFELRDMKDLVQLKLPETKKLFIKSE
jgi:hypothetical protein